jgi:hypothetical protein
VTALELALFERGVVALERIAGALSADTAPRVPDETLAADFALGLSYRQCAAKHGVGVGRVRGAVARFAKPTDASAARG